MANPVDRRPMQGVRVLEVANWIAAPAAGAWLADMGADVVKVEPAGGDSMRGLLRQAAVPDAAEIDHPFQQANRGKRSIAIDLDSEEGQAIVHRLLPSFDIITTNLLPGRLQRFGLDDASILATHPTAVVAQVSSFGRDGEDADQPGFDLTAFFARGGAMSAVASPESGPVRFRPGQGDHMTSLNFLVGILSALRLRDMTGEGQVVHTSLFQTSAWALGVDISTALVDGESPPMVSRTAPPNPLVNTYRCGDGKWLNLVSPMGPAWRRVCAALERPDWIDDPRYKRHLDRAERTAEIVEQLDAIFASRSRDEWGSALTEAGVTWAAIAEVADVVNDEQLRANNAIATIDHPSGSFETLNTPFGIEGADVEVRGPAPSIGADTAAVLREAGFATDEITAFSDSGVVVDGASS